VKECRGSLGVDTANLTVPILKTPPAKIKLSEEKLKATNSATRQKGRNRSACGISTVPVRIVSAISKNDLTYTEFKLQHQHHTAQRILPSHRIISPVIVSAEKRVLSTSLACSPKIRPELLSAKCISFDDSEFN